MYLAAHNVPHHVSGLNESHLPTGVDPFLISRDTFGLGQVTEHEKSSHHNQPPRAGEGSDSTPGLDLDGHRIG